MARTAKWEHPSDSIRQRQAEERCARTPQRDRVAFEADLALDAEEG
jgi:hypothetical protein